MSFIEIKHKDGSREVLGDKDQYRRATGQPYRKADGTYVFKDEDIDRPGETNFRTWGTL